MKKEKTPEEQIAELRKTIINCIPDHSPAWKDATIEQLDKLLELTQRKEYNEGYLDGRKAESFRSE